MNKKEKYLTQILWRKNKILSQTEDNIILYLEGLEIPDMTSRECSLFKNNMDEVNRERRRLKMLDLPHPRRKVRHSRCIRRIEPLVQLSYPEIASNMSIQDVVINEAKHQDLVMAAQIELDTIRYISTGVWPQMDMHEKLRYNKYLKIVNNQRIYHEGYELELDKTYLEHIRIEHPEYEFKPDEQSLLQIHNIIESKSNNNECDQSIQSSIEESNNDSDSNINMSVSSESVTFPEPEISQGTPEESATCPEP